MKKLLLTTMCMLGLAACANGSNKENNTKKENTMKTIALTKADFLTKVANYETNPTVLVKTELVLLLLKVLHF